LAIFLSGVILFFLRTDAFALEYTLVPVLPAFITPFVMLLLAIAFMQFINADLWGKRYPIICLVLGLIPLIYYFLILKYSPRMISTAFEYLSFICRIG
jgi:hypothetical protein